MTSPQFIVTGGAGFIGSNIVEELNRRGYKNILVVDNLDDPRKKQNLEGLQYAEYLDKTDFRQRFLSDSIPAPATVFHLGACSSTTETNEPYIMDNNFLYTRQLCEWCLRHNTRFIYASSAATYGDGNQGYSDSHDNAHTLQPLNLYGRSKQLFDLWALENSKLNRIAGVKFFNVYGPREDHKDDMRSVVNKAFAQILATGRMKLFKSHHPKYRDGEQLRDFVYVKDAARMTLFLHDHPEVSGLYNCGTGKARSWLDLARAVFAAMARTPAIDFVDMPIEIRDKYQYYTQADMTKLLQAGYTTPFASLEEGVTEYVKTFLAPRHRT